MPNPFRDFIAHIHTGPAAFAKELAERLSVPYLEERQGERLLGHRLKEVPQEEAIKQGLFPTRRFRSPTGEVLETDEFPPMDHEQLTEEVWTKDNWQFSSGSATKGTTRYYSRILPHALSEHSFGGPRWGTDRR